MTRSCTFERQMTAMGDGRIGDSCKIGSGEYIQPYSPLFTHIPETDEAERLLI